jgi:hypothetical protein
MFLFIYGPRPEIMMMIVVILGHKCERGMVTGREGKGKDTEEEEDQNTQNMFRDSIMKPTQHCLKNKEKIGGNENTVEGVNMLKVHCHLFGIITMIPPHTICLHYNHLKNLYFLARL